MVTAISRPILRMKRPKLSEKGQTIEGSKSIHTLAKYVAAQVNECKSQRECPWRPQRKVSHRAIHKHTGRHESTKQQGPVSHSGNRDRVILEAN